MLSSVPSALVANAAKAVTVPPVHERIFANGAKLECWDAYNMPLFSVLHLSIKALQSINTY